jgi:hypothetical protein
MNFIIKNKTALLFVGSIFVLVLALFWPETKKAGELQKYYTRPADQLVAISYKGEMQLADKQKVLVAYDILKEENLLKPKEPVYRIEVRELYNNRQEPYKTRRRTFSAEEILREFAREDNRARLGCPRLLFSAALRARRSKCQRC